MSTSSTSTTRSEEVSTSLLYNRWAAAYDTDRNPLQILDSALIPSLLSTLFSLPSDAQNGTTITEIGCGTGRNTIRLLTPLFRRAYPVSTLLISRPQCLTWLGLVAPPSSQTTRATATRPEFDSPSSTPSTLEATPKLRNWSEERRILS